MAGEIDLTKRPAEVIKYDFDFTVQTGDASLTLQGTPTLAITPQGKVPDTPPLTETGGVAQGGKAQFTISDGADGELYKLVCTAQDDQGQTHVMTGWLEVESVRDTVDLIVEDGTMKQDADAFVSLADADAYFAARNNAAWQAATAGEREAAIREGTRLIHTRYRWPGEIQSELQALSWPRYDAYHRDGKRIDPGIVPQEVQDATCEAALLSLSGSLIPATDRGGRIKSARVGPIQVTYEDQADPHRSFEWLDQILVDLYVRRGRRRGPLMRA